eukprot:TRINITY_DN112315_c0_g1_i1.p2 TRINITY_DN112315_c0_g1~~TRINITY_DN112315_c0_g1_i1.p2  ORF type:complete len:211 (-),score=82.76 TRINITY_DN112315_c0_g1_i1:378-1010(-)
MAEEADAPEPASTLEEEAAEGEGEEEGEGEDEAPMEDAPADDDDEEDADVPEPAERGEDEEDEEEDEAEGTAAAGSQASKPAKRGPPVRKDKDKKNRSMGDKAGVQFPVHRIRKSMLRGAYSKKVNLGAAIYLTTVIEYVVAEILELAGNNAKEMKKQRIIPRHILLAVRNDEELNKYLSNVTITGGGVLPNIHQVLFPSKAAKEAAPPA